LSSSADSEIMVKAAKCRRSQTSEQRFFDN
jgi:hypothetical protein